MKVLLYAEGLKTIGKSGLGHAIKHQMAALEKENIPYTLDPKCTDYDILHINTYFTKSFFMFRKAKKMGKKIVYHAHSTEEDYRDGFILGHATSKIFKWWICYCYKHGDVIITPTPYSKKILEGYDALKGKKIYAISNGIDLDLFKKNKDDRKNFLKRYGYKSSNKIIIGIGLYIRRKGIVDFVELAKRLPQYEFIWFGESPLSVATSDVKKAVKTELPNLKFAGYVEQPLIREALCACDLYLFPTLEETEGIPIIEACACAATSIIRDIPIFDGWLRDNKDVYKAKDVDEFETKIKDYFDGKLPKLGNIYKIAEDRSIEKVGKELKKVYEDVMKK